jgi:hypothetical protein
MIRRDVALEARLIDDVLDLARIGRGTLQLKREVTDAHQLVAHVIEICKNDLAKGASSACWTGPPRGTMSTPARSDPIQAGPPEPPARPRQSQYQPATILLTLFA